MSGAETPPPRRFRRSARPPLPAAPGDPVGFPGVRLTTTAAELALDAAADRIILPRPPWARGPLDILALSGGAAGGAFGAGVLVGLTRAGRRPRFAIVTGVSTGALIAPLAFLGPEWDDRLTDSYTGGHAARLLGLRGLAPGVEPGLYRGEALDGLIRPFIDERLLIAVAGAHAAGRRLFVATTDLDRQAACIWDMGAIAAQGVAGDRAAALALFRTVLAASASLPGLFPPRLIACQTADGDRYDEMHVDGGLASPLFVLPDALLRWKGIGRRLRGGRLHVIVNMVLQSQPAATPRHATPVIIRSVDTLMRFSYRQAVNVAAAFCAGAGLPMVMTSIPADRGADNMLNFDTATMRRTFDDAVALAADPALWVDALPGVSRPSAPRFRPEGRPR